MVLSHQSSRTGRADAEDKRDWISADGVVLVVGIVASVTGDNSDDNTWFNDNDELLLVVDGGRTGVVVVLAGW